MRQKWTRDARNAEAEWWAKRLEGNEEAIEVVRDLYQTEVAGIIRLEDKIQGQINVIGVLVPVGSAAMATIGNGLIETPQCVAAWLSAALALSALVELWTAYLAAREAHKARPRWQLDGATLREALDQGSDLRVRAGATEATAVELNTCTSLILSNCLEGARMSITRALVLISVAVVLFLLWVR